MGGGHSHVQVIRSLMMEPLADARLTLVVDRPVAVYSGMVPGFVAGQYRADELEIDVLPLARLAGARIIMSAAIGVDAEAKRILLEGRSPIRYDIASIDIGSTVSGLELPGIRRHAVPTRPIGNFVARVDEIVQRIGEQRDAEETYRLVVVGGGAGGVELAFAMERRLCTAGVLRLAVTLIHGGDRILPGYSDRLRRKVEVQARERGIEIHCGRKVEAAEADHVVFEDGERLEYDTLFWVTGAISHPFFADSGLPTDSRGFVLTRSTLQVEGHDDLFAAGDCATLIDYPQTPKAGVYAVRQGPPLTHNLRAKLSGDRLRTYKPQSDFLMLLNLGDGKAIGGKWGFAWGGKRVMRLKDKIDRKFMRRFQVLAPEGEVSEEFSQMAEMEEMLCGGCAAKIGQPVLGRVLARLGPGPAEDGVLLGLDVPDDAAAVTTPKGEVLATTIDAFKAFTDDPYLVGRVAAINAVSDLYATGVEPRQALAMVVMPEGQADEAAEELLFQVLSGARAAFDDRGISLLGGHTTTSTELMVGFSIHGFASGPEALLRIDQLAAGQVLILTKALGTGVLLHADMQGKVRGPWLQAAFASMLRGNDQAAEAARTAGVVAATDITGYGLAGHLAEMVRASGASATIEAALLPALPGALELLTRGERSTFHPKNEHCRRGMLISPQLAGDSRVELLFDPQTSGGLLLAVEARRGGELIDLLRRAGDEAAVAIGRVEESREDGALIVVE